MSHNQQDAVVQEYLDQCYTWRQAVALRNGLPFVPERNRVKPSNGYPKRLVDLIGSNAQELKPVPVAEEREEPPKIPTWIKALGLIAAGSGLGVGAGYLSSLEGHTGTPTAPVVKEDKRQGNLLHWLDQEGFNKVQNHDN